MSESPPVESSTTAPMPAPMTNGVDHKKQEGGALNFSELKGGRSRRRRNNNSKRRGGSIKGHHNNSKRRHHNNSKRRRQRGGK